MKKADKIARAPRRAKNRSQMTGQAFELIAARFRALAEPMRLRILHSLGDREMSVGELVEVTGAGQANVSKHLAILLEAHLLSRRKEGLNVFYRVADETVFDLCDAVCAGVGQRLAAQQTAMKRFAGR